MKRTLITAAAATLCAVLAPAAASASLIELGTTSSPLVAPTCPSGVSQANCTIILTKVTAVETLRDGVAYPATVKKAGRIVAFTVGLSSLSSNRTQARNDIHLLDTSYGGTTRVALSVLKRSGAARLRRWTLVAQSPVFRVQPYLGQVVQFPLTSSLSVTPGEVVALTTPTWAPVLSISLASSKFAYRQSRSASCTTPPTSFASPPIGQTAAFGCNYPGTRVEYTASEITNPVAVNPIHAPDIRRR
jgi:hypothetical protein